MEPDPSIHGKAYFSTNAGKWAPKAFTESRPIARGDGGDVDFHDELLEQLRRAFPEKCKSITTPILHEHEVYEYFDGKDVSHHGFVYLRNLLDQMAIDNRNRLAKMNRFISDWRNKDENHFWALQKKATVEEEFSESEVSQHGRGFLQDVLQRVLLLRPREPAEGTTK